MKIISLRRFIVLFVISLLIFPHISFAETEDTPEFTEASVHDPSVIKVGDDYYVFGSHLAAAKTNDFLNWEQISTGVTSENPLFDNVLEELDEALDRKSTRLNSSHVAISYAVFCLKKKTHTYLPIHFQNVQLSL